MSPGALYRYFPSKDAIIGAIAEEERVAAGACMAALQGEGSILDRVTAVAMEYLRSSRDSATGGLMIEICSESLRNTAVGKRFHEIEKVVRDAFHETLQRAQQDGDLDPTIDLLPLMTVLFAIGDGLVVRLQLEPETDVETIEPFLRRALSGLFRLPPGS